MYVRSAVADWCRDHRVEPPTDERCDRLIASAVHHFEEAFFAEIHAKLSDQIRVRLNALIGAEISVEAADDPAEAIRSGFNLLKSDPGRIGLASVEREVTKLNRIRELNLPDGLWSHASPKLLDRYRTRAATESIRELRRHAAPVYPAVSILLAAPQRDHRWTRAWPSPGAR